MLARLQRWISLSLLGAALIWAACLLRLDRPAWAAIGVLVVCFAHAFFLAAEFLMLARVQTPLAAPLPSAWQMISAWWGEVVTAPRVFYWRQPYRSKAEPDRLFPDARGRRGVVLVHGMLCNRGFWNPWMRELRRRQIPFAAPNLEPVFGNIEQYEAAVDAAVARVEAATGLPPLLVGHSMGGLAIRTWLAGAGRATRAHRIVTIGTPHHGTWLARNSHTVSGRQMRQDSAWLQALAARERPGVLERFVCFFSHCDNVVFPSAVATLPGALNVHLPATAHVQMAFRPDVLETVLRLLDSPAPPG